MKFDQEKAISFLFNVMTYTTSDSYQRFFRTLDYSAWSLRKSDIKEFLRIDPQEGDLFNDSLEYLIANMEMDLVVPGEPTGFVQCFFRNGGDIVGVNLTGLSGESESFQESFWDWFHA